MNRFVHISDLEVTYIEHSNMIKVVGRQRGACGELGDVATVDRFAPDWFSIDEQPRREGYYIVGDIITSPDLITIMSWYWSEHSRTWTHSISGDILAPVEITVPERYIWCGIPFELAHKFNPHVAGPL